MIRLTVNAKHLTTAVQIADKFRSTDESRPILTTMLVRIRNLGTAKMPCNVVEWITTDSYRVVKVQTPFVTAEDDVEMLEGPGVMIVLPYAEIRRLNTAMRKVAGFANYTIVMSSRDENGTFGLTRTGAWNGRGCYVTADVDALPTVASGERRSGTYPNVDGLWPEKYVVDLSAPIAWNARYIAEMAECAALIGPKPTPMWNTVQGPLKLVHTVDPLKPAVFAASYDEVNFEALVMPVRTK